MSAASPRVVVVGAGPAGLTAAYELSKHGIATTVVEKDETTVGGISRTVQYKGFRFDIGGHRFFTKIPEVRRVWDELLADAFLTRPRLSRIYYDRKFFHYPLRPLDALRKVGPIETARIVGSYAWARLFPEREERNLEQWVRNRFGHRLYSMFFKTYTEKVWGIPCTELGADWAAQRIQNLSLGTAIKKALFGRRGDDSVKTLIDEFQYPELGPGQMWERCRDVVVQRGHRVAMGRSVHRVHHHDGRIVGLTAVDAAGRLERLDAEHVISSMPLSELVQRLDPLPPQQVREAAARLRYRDFLTVSLVIDAADLFPDNWIYVHSPEVRLGRIQNFKNWSPAMVPDPSKTCLGLEYFVFEGQGLWTEPDAALIELGAREVEALGLASRKQVLDGAVVRMPKAYPVYDGAFRAAVATIRGYLGSIAGLQQIGRNGQHRYNNQDHSMLTALLAARNVLGERHDVWDVNLDPEYHETLERQVPQRLRDRREVAVR